MLGVRLGQDLVKVSTSVRQGLRGFGFKVKWLRINSVTAGLSEQFLCRSGAVSVQFLCNFNANTDSSPARKAGSPGQRVGKSHQS